MLAVVAAGAALLWVVGGILEVALLVFAGGLVGLCLSGAGAWVAKRARLPRALCVAAICLGLVGIAALATWAAAPAVATQVDELRRSLPRAVDEGAAALGRYDWGRALVERARHLDDFFSRKETLTRAGGLLSTTFGAIGGFFVFLFIALFVAFEPDLYRRGFLRLVPMRRRKRVGDVLTEMAHVLLMWMVGKLLAMLGIGLALCANVRETAACGSLV